MKKSNRKNIIKLLTEELQIPDLEKLERALETKALPADDINFIISIAKLYSITIKRLLLSNKKKKRKKVKDNGPQLGNVVKMTANWKMRKPPYSYGDMGIIVGILHTTDGGSQILYNIKFNEKYTVSNVQERHFMVEMKSGQLW